MAYVGQLSFVTTNIIGANKMNQLKENINSIHIELSATILSEVETVYNKNA